MLTDPERLNLLTHKVIGCAMCVHHEFGAGLVESAYMEALIIELRERSLKVDVRSRVPLVYRGRKLSTYYEMDICIEDKVIVEVKSVAALAPIHTAQLITYLKLTGRPIGLLINFNVPLLKDGVKRILNPRLARQREDQPRVEQSE